MGQGLFLRICILFSLVCPFKSTAISISSSRSKSSISLSVLSVTSKKLLKDFFTVYFQESPVEGDVIETAHSTANLDDIGILYVVLYRARQCSFNTHPGHHIKTVRWF